MQFSVQLNDVLRLLPFVVPIKDTAIKRLAGLGVRLEVAPGGGTLLMATDGPTLGAFHDPNGSVSWASGESFLIPVSVITAAKGLRRGSAGQTVHLHSGGRSRLGGEGMTEVIA